MTTTKEFDSRADWLAAATTARAAHATFTLRGYCDNPRCPVRTVAVDVKDYEREFPAHIQRNGVRCPVCGLMLLCSGIEASR
jgi:hypothetical protein